MENTSRSKIETLLANQRTFFATHQTKEIGFRLQQLKNFKAAILKYEDQIYEALWQDLHKSQEEVFLTELSIVLQEIDNHIKHLKRWAKPTKVSTPLSLMPSRCRMLYEPLGVALIIAPWNYPFQLLLNSLIGAISAGCCTILKASPYVPAIAKVMEEIVTDCFPDNYIAMTQGNREVNAILLEQKFDIIMFTGSPDLGKIVMKAAAEHLTPVVLELGGKSPAIVDKEANIDIAAKRIAWGKTINAGQTCIAPDYLFIHRSVKKQFIESYKKAVCSMFGDDCKTSPHYPRIVNMAAIERLKTLMQHGKIVFGGEVNDSEKYIAPTLIDEVASDFPIMQQEIFGPLLPILTFDNIEEVISHVNGHEKPLAFYYFGKDKQAKNILRQTTSGGGCINDTLMHIANHHLPFGGVGNSGMGAYHGKESFLAFSHKRSIVISPTWVDLPVKYAPYKRFWIIRKLMK
ncbi:MAG: aldehyde dehydrogenase [Bacteroidales bacterium]|jgi:aldehyde dehydrogenase (NAD+)|nr:aldehyde dehydrogenase [Bacteroidales bacterium]